MPVKAPTGPRETLSRDRFTLNFEGRPYLSKSKIVNYNARQQLITAVSEIVESAAVDLGPATVDIRTVKPDRVRVTIEGPAGSFGFRSNLEAVKLLALDHTIDNQRFQDVFGNITEREEGLLIF